VTFRPDLDIELLLRWLAGWTDRHRLWVVLTAFLLAAVSVMQAARDLSVNTDSSEMIHAAEPFRVNAKLRDRLFPHIKNQILVIVRAGTPDEADYATEILVSRLREETDRIRDIFAPTANDFFQRQGLLFLSLGDLIETSNRLGSSAPLLEDLIADPSLPQFFAQLSRAARASEEGVELAMVAGAYDEVARVIESVTAGEPAPMSWQRMFGLAEDVNQRLVVVDPILDYESLQPARPAIEALEGAIDGLPSEVRASADISLTGDPVLRTQELESVSDGIEISAAVSLVLVSFLLTFGLRSWQLVLACLSSLLTSLALTTGFAALVFDELNLVSIAFTVLLIGLGIDFAIHLTLYYRERINAGGDHAGAMTGALTAVGPALALAMLTTSVAFFAFVPTRFVGMAQLGIISGVGVIIAFFVSVTVIPAVLALLPDLRPKFSRLRFLERLDRSFKRSAIPVAGLSVLLGLAAAAIAPQAHFEADPMALRDPESPAVKAFNLLFDRPEDTPYRLNYIGDSLDRALAFASRAERLPLVHAAITLDDFVPENQDAKLAEIDFLAGDLAFVLTEADELDAERIAEAEADRGTAREEVVGLTEAAAQVAELEPGTARGRAARRLKLALEDLLERADADPGLYELLEDNLLRFFPRQMARLRLQLTARPVTMSDLPPEIRRRYVAPSGEVRVEVLPALDVRDPEERRDFVEAVEALDGRLAGGAYAVLSAADVVADAMVQATVTAFLLGALLVYALMRSIAFTVMVMVPLALAALLTVASGVLIGLPFNFANVIVLPLLIGLGVDSSIHLVMRSRRISDSRDIFSTSTPRAVLLSALTTLASFGSLALSDHRGTASMGELLTIAIGFTLLATLVMLPGLMALRERLRNGPAGNRAGRESDGTR